MEAFSSRSDTLKRKEEIWHLDQTPLASRRSQSWRFSNRIRDCRESIYIFWSHVLWDDTSVSFRAKRRSSRNVVAVRAIVASSQSVFIQGVCEQCRMTLRHFCCLNDDHNVSGQSWSADHRGDNDYRTDLEHDAGQRCHEHQRVSFRQLFILGRAGCEICSEN